MPEVIKVRAGALRANGDKVLLVVSGPTDFIFEVENPEALSDGIIAALIGRDDYRAHIRRAVELEQLVGRGI